MQYDRQARVIQRDLYDSQNILHTSTFLTYDEKGRITKEENSTGQMVFYSYDANGNCVYTKGPDLNVETYNTYDFANRKIRSEAYHADGSVFVESLRYDYLGNIIGSTDIYGNETRYTYNEFSKPIKIELPPTQDAEGNNYIPTETFEYDHFGNQISHTDPAGHTTRKRFTILGHPQEIEYPDGSVERFEYAINGKLEKKVEKNGSYIHYTYDLLGRKITEETHTADHTLLSSKSWNYDAFNLLSEIDANGNLTLYTYDNAGRKISEARGDSVTFFTYDNLSRVHKTSQPYGDKPEETSIQICEYDKLNNVIEERTEDGLEKVLKLKQYTYDLLGNCLRTTTYQEINNPLTTIITYNSFKEPIQVCDPQGNVTHYTYNHNFVSPSKAIVLQKTTTDPKGIQTIETYNVQGKPSLIERKDPYGKLLSKEHLKYDRKGNLAYWKESAISNGQEISTVINRKQHGPSNRVEAIIEAEGTPEQKIVRYAYNALGQQEKSLSPMEFNFAADTMHKEGFNNIRLQMKQ